MNVKVIPYTIIRSRVNFDFERKQSVIIQLVYHEIPGSNLTRDTKIRALMNKSCNARMAMNCDKI